MKKIYIKFFNSCKLTKDNFFYLLCLAFAQKNNTKKDRLDVKLETYKYRFE